MRLSEVSLILDSDKALKYSLQAESLPRSTWHMEKDHSIYCTTYGWFLEHHRFECFAVSTVHWFTWKTWVLVWIVTMVWLPSPWRYVRYAISVFHSSWTPPVHALSIVPPDEAVIQGCAAETAFHNLAKQCFNHKLNHWKINVKYGLRRAIISGGTVYPMKREFPLFSLTQDQLQST